MLEEERIAKAQAARRASIDEVKLVKSTHERFEDENFSKMRKMTFNDSGGSYTGDEMSESCIDDIDTGI